MRISNRALVIVAAVLGGLWLMARYGAAPMQLPWNSSPITVPGGHYGGGQ